MNGNQWVQPTTTTNHNWYPLESNDDAEDVLNITIACSTSRSTSIRYSNTEQMKFVFNATKCTRRSRWVNKRKERKKSVGVWKIGRKAHKYIIRTIGMTVSPIQNQDHLHKNHRRKRHTTRHQEANIVVHADR